MQKKVTATSIQQHPNDLLPGKEKRKAGFLGTQSLSGVWGVPTNPLFIGGGAGMKTGKLAKKKT
jgi:hypothetical protein